MDFDTTIDIILKDLREVREIIDDLKNYPGIPLLQVELAKSKCRSAEEVIALLKVIRPAAAEAVSAPHENVTVKQAHAKQPQESVPEDLIEISSVQEEEEHIIADEPEKPERATELKTAAAEKKGPSAIMADSFTGHAGTVSDRLGTGRKKDDLASVIKRISPVGDLSDSIGLSDKFLFIKEIFKGNKSAYDQAIEKLNRVENIPDAMAVIMSYTGESGENEAVQQLLDIVKRKLPEDE